VTRSSGEPNRSKLTGVDSPVGRGIKPASPANGVSGNIDREAAEKPTFRERSPKGLTLPMSAQAIPYRLRSMAAVIPAHQGLFQQED